VQHVQLVVQQLAGRMGFKQLRKLLVGAWLAQPRLAVPDGAT
jgi:hypothetical protein